MNNRESIQDIFAHLNDPKELAKANQRFLEMSAKYPTTEFDRIIKRAKEIQEWHSIKDICMT
jgi:hypothetical protein